MTSTQAQLPATSPAILVRRPRARVVPSWRTTAAVLILAAGLRIIWALLVPVAPVSDSVAYDTFARNLARGLPYGFDGINPSAFWPVGAPFLYSLGYRLLDPATWGYLAPVILNIALGVAMVVLAMGLARQWFGPRIAVITGLCLALWPTHIQFATIIASETVFTVLCLAATLAWPRPGHARPLSRAMLAGALLAAATYARPTAVLIPLVLAGSDLLRGLRPRTVLAHLAIAAAVMGAAIAPWSARNARLFGQFVLVSTNGGSNLWMGNNPETTGHYMTMPPRPAHMNEAQFDRALGHQAKAYILAHPDRFAARTLVKAVRLHERETIGIAWNQDALRPMIGERAMLLLKLISQGYWMLMLAAALGGVVLLARQYHLRTVAHPALAIWGYFTAIHAVIVIQDRYHLPATPMIASLAALALAALWEARPRRAPEATA